MLDLFDAKPLPLRGVGRHAEAHARNFALHREPFHTVAIDMLAHGVFSPSAAFAIASHSSWPGRYLNQNASGNIVASLVNMARRRRPLEHGVRNGR